MRPAHLLLALLWAPVALAAEGDSTDPVVDPAEPEEVIVIGDPFARWDGTRWHIETQIGMPVPYPLYAERNHEMDAIAVQVRAILACEKTWRRSKKFHEVDCQISDVGLQAASWRAQEPYAQAILDGFDTLLTGAELQMIVADDGRVTNVDLEGIPEDNDRQKAVAQQARNLLTRLIAGFHMRLPPRNQIKEGQWVEYDASLFQMPVVVDNGRQQNDRRAPVVINSLSGSYVIHQLDRYKGHLVVQSKGEGTIEIGDLNSDQQSWFKVELDGVSIYDPDTAIMTERVWSLRGRTTASSVLAEGRVDPRYFHSGRFRMLDEGQTPDVGPTQLVTPPEATPISLPAWDNIE